MVGEKESPEHSGREAGKESEAEKKQGKKSARVLGRELEEGNIRLFSIFAYDAVKSRAEI